MTMLHGDITSICVVDSNQSIWLHIGDFINGQEVRHFKELQTLSDAPKNSEYVLESADGLIAKFENFLNVEEQKEKGHLQAVTINGKHYEVGKLVNGREVMAIHKYVEYFSSETTTIVLQNSNLEIIPYKNLRSDAVEVWYSPFEPF